VISENPIDAFAADDSHTPDATASAIAQRCPQVLTRDTQPQSLRPPPSVPRLYALAATATGLNER
jgi:hypothetical protein